MNRSQWAESSFQALAPFFAEKGFVFIPVMHQFRKETESGWQNIIFNFSHYEDCSLVEVSFGTRLELVENLIAPFTFGIRAYQAESNTCITNMSKYLKDPQFRFKLMEQADIKRMTAWIKDFFRREGFHFLNKISQTSDLDTLYNKEPRKDCLVSYNHQLRCFRGLAIAALQQNPDREHLYQEYLEVLKRYASPHVVSDRFREFSRHLAITALN